MRPAMLLLHHRGINKAWCFWWIIAWTLAVLSAQIRIFRIDPTISAGSISLQQLGAIGLCLPVVLIAILVEDQTPWLTASSPRSSRLLRLATATLVMTIGLVTAMAAAILYPDGISWIRVVSLFALLLAMTLVAGTLIGGPWAALPAPAFLILNTVPGLVPWEWNIVYNPGTDTALVSAAVAVTAFVFIARGLPQKTEGEPDSE